MKFIQLLLCVAIFGCATQQPLPPLPPNDPGDHPTVDEAKDDVERVCAVLRKHNCEEGQNTAEGNTCETVIRNAAREGIDLVGDVECMLRANSCEAARQCE